jgi:hypothetical protein
MRVKSKNTTKALLTVTAVPTRSALPACSLVHENTNRGQIKPKKKTEDRGLLY